MTDDWQTHQQTHQQLSQGDTVWLGHSGKSVVVRGVQLLTVKKLNI